MIHELMTEAQQILETYGLWAMAGSIFVDAFGAPTPGESLLIVAGLLASEGKMQLGPIMLVAWIASVMGDNIGYLIGRLGGRRLILRFGHHVYLTEARLAYAERFFERYGAAVVLGARFVAILRQLNGIIAGSSNMPWPKFLIYNAIGAALWVAAWCASAFYLGKGMIKAFEHFNTLEPYLIALGFAIILGFAYVAHRIWLKRKDAESQATSP